MTSNSAAYADNEMAVGDLGPLAWVLDELRKSLDSSSKALRRFAREAEESRGKDLTEIDSTQLRITRQQLHQAVGAMEMVGLAAPANMLRGMESLAQKYVQYPHLCNEDGVMKMERAGFALLEYLEGVLKGKKSSSVALFPQYRDVMDLAGSERIHPADLWNFDWRWKEVSIKAKPITYSSTIRGELDQSVLKIVKSADPMAAAHVAMRCASLSAAYSGNAKTFWAICAGYFEALSFKLCPADVYTKRIASKVLQQYATLAKGQSEISERLAQDLLFYCAQATPQRAQATPFLSAVRLAYRLTNSRPVQYEKAQFGQFDPELLNATRKKISTAAETWSALAGGDVNRLKVVNDQFLQVADAIVKMHPESKVLATAMMNAVASTVRSGAAPSPSVAMEIATSILYLEAAYEDLDPTDNHIAERGERLAQRLDQVVSGGEPDLMESWMEDLYRRVSDRQTMGSVVDELRGSLNDVEKCLDIFFRNPSDPAPLREVPGRLSQMRGVFSVLGLEQPAIAAMRMKSNVEQFMVDKIDPESINVRGSVFEKIGNSLGAMGFLIDMISYQRSLAKQLFVFDEAENEFKPLMGRERSEELEDHAEEEFVAEMIQEPAAAEHVSVAQAVKPKEEAELFLAPDISLPLASQPQGGNANALVAPAGAALELDPGMDLGFPAVSADDALIPPVLPQVPTVETPISTVSTVSSSSDDEDDGELLDIFQEEAKEVVQTGLSSIAALRLDPSNLADLTTLRRAFHTLKGSSRMVGLNDFGEAAWAYEQMMNSWLADQKQAGVDLLNQSQMGMEAFGLWIQDIESKSKDIASKWSHDVFRTSADAMRLERSFVSLAIPGITNFDDVTQKAHEEPAEDVVAAMPEIAEIDIPSIALGATAVPMDSILDDEVEVATQVIELELPPTFPVEAVTQEQVAPAIELEFPTEVSPEDNSIKEESDQIEVSQHEQLETTESAQGGFDANMDFGDFDFGDTDNDLVATASAEPATTEVEQTNAQEQPGFEQAEVDTQVPNLEVEAYPVGGVAANEERYKLIGDLRIGLPLYNVFINEADERSRALQIEVSEWAIELRDAVSDSVVSLAHSLAGSSATVGFNSLSNLARMLEHAAQHAQAHDLTTPHVAAVFVAASDEISDLLHQFAAGFLKEARPEVLADLQDVLDAVSPFVGENRELGVVDQDGSADQDEFTHAEEQDSVLGMVEATDDDEPVVLVQAPLNLSIPSEPSGFALETESLIKAEDSASAIEDVLTKASEPVQAVAEIELDAESLIKSEDVASAIEDVATESANPIIQVENIALNSEDLIKSEDNVSAIEDVLTDASEPVVATSHISLNAEDLIKSEDVASAIEDVATEASASIHGASEIELDSESLLKAEDVASVVDEMPLEAVEKIAAPVVASAAPLKVIENRLDDIDLADKLDLDLLPIFQEEAVELFPQLGTCLRKWVENPLDISSRSLVLRQLHTIKGGARLAGAMRLGEMTHNMESSIEELGADNLQSSQIEPLLSGYDEILKCFEGLGKPQEAKIQDGADAHQSVAEKDGVVAALQASDAQTKSTLSPIVRVRSQLLERLVNQAGEVIITRSRMDSRLGQLKTSMFELSDNLEKLRAQLRDIELQAESQMQSRLAQTKDHAQGFDPLEFDRFTRVQELTRMMAESVNDVATVQRNLHRSIEGAEDDLIAQSRQTRELQRDLLKTRMVEFESISDRLYGVVRQACKDAGKQVRLDIVGGSIDMDRGILDRVAPAFEHLLRNSVGHGIESQDVRIAAGKSAIGNITITVEQAANDVSVSFNDDGGGLQLEKIRAKALTNGLIGPDQVLTEKEAANLIFAAGFSTADALTSLSGRGIGMDVVRTEITALGGRIETSTIIGKGTTFKLILPLTTAVTQVVMMRMGDVKIGVPASLLETVLRVPADKGAVAYKEKKFAFGDQEIPFVWGGSLLQISAASLEATGKTWPVVVLRSAGQRMAMHVDEVQGNREVVVKNLGPQMARLPGLSGMSVLANGDVVLIYNPVALANVYGLNAPQTIINVEAGAANDGSNVVSAEISKQSKEPPLVLVVDDSITVRRVTQRLLKREGYRVSLAADGLQAIERLQEEIPEVVLSDIEMPRMDGFDLARNIRGDARLKGLPIIMITSRIAEKHREHARELGVDHYLGKPYSEDELLALVRNYCHPGSEVAQAIAA